MLARGVAAFEEAKAEAALEDPKAKKKRERWESAFERLIVQAKVIALIKIAA